MRTALVVLALALAAPLTLLAPPAHAAGETCHGLPATAVGADGYLQGTSGDDVLVARDRTTLVNSGAGNDVICLVSTIGTVGINAGEGDDAVDTTQTAGDSYVQLGTGANTFLGGSGEDAVTYGGPDFHVTTAGTDTVSTGSGQDLVSVVVGSIVDLGPDDDDLIVYAPPGSYTTDHGLDGGEGRDQLVVYADQDLTVDLQQHTLDLDVVNAPLSRFEDLVGSARHVSVTGNYRANKIVVEGCRVQLTGLGGNDRLALDRVDEDGVFDSCAGKPRGALRGNNGDDVLFGRDGADTLIGGPGRDVAWGQKGRDRCSAEVEKHCER